MVLAPFCSIVPLKWENSSNRSWRLVPHPSFLMEGVRNQLEENTSSCTSKGCAADRCPALRVGVVSKEPTKVSHERKF